MEDIVAIVMVFGTAMVGAIAFSPVGAAIGDRLRNRGGGSLRAEELEDMRAHLASLQEQVSELAERQDFSERLLSQVKERSQSTGQAGT